MPVSANGLGISLVLTARCTIVHSAVLRLHVVRPSVCPSVTMVDQDHPNKSPLYVLEKREHGRIQGLPKFLMYAHIISGTGKATKFKFCTHIHRLNWNKSPLTILGKAAGCVVRTLETFQGPIGYIGRIARSSLR